MDEFEKNLNSGNNGLNNQSKSDGLSNGINDDGVFHTAAIEMNETPASQENTPSQAQAKIEVADTTEASAKSSYTLNGSALGSNARETIDTVNTGHNTVNTEHNNESSNETYKSAAYSNQAYNNGYNYAHNYGNGNVPYNEHVNSKKNKKTKTDRKPMRYVAALLAAAVLNLAILGGAFALGHSLGAQSSTVDNKATLSQELKTDDSAATTSGITKTASTDGEKDTTQIAKEVGPAVVGIKSTIQGQVSMFGGTTTSEAQGSGIIMSSDGYIVTNNHVVEDASAVTVQLNTGSEYEAEIIGTDEQTDLAVIKINSSEELTVAVLGNSENVEVGETAIAIGNPMGLEFFGSVTQGIISAVNRTITVDNRTMNLIQTDAAINSGNSGGALVNSRGEVIGINTVKVSTTGVEGMGFAIPISEAKPIISDLLEYGYVKGRPVIGISTRDVTQYYAQRYGWPEGAQIMAITTQNALDAGLQQGDIITKIDGQAITSGSDLTDYKDTKSPGDTVTLEVYKYATGKTETVNVVLSEQIPD